MKNRKNVLHNDKEWLMQECEWIANWANTLRKDVEYNYDKELIEIDIKGLKHTIESFEYWNARYDEKEAEV